MYWLWVLQGSVDGGGGGLSIADSLKQAAEDAVQQSGYVYDEQSGLYYDYKSGYYYDPVSMLEILPPFNLS